MLCWISILGGLLIMMGQHARAEALFYYFRREDQVPEDHLLRLMSAIPGTDSPGRHDQGCAAIAKARSRGRDAQNTP